MARLAGFLRGQPFVIDGMLILGVVFHAIVVAIGLVPNLWNPLIKPENADQVRAIYLALLGPSAIVAGFAGVVVVFGLTANSIRFQNFRVQAGESLVRTWVSASSSGFVAGATSLCAAVVTFFDASLAAPFLFEAALLLLMHGSIRLIWILAKLIGVVRHDDITATDKSREFKMEEFLRRPHKGQAE